ADVCENRSALSFHKEVPAVSHPPLQLRPRSTRGGLMRRFLLATIFLSIIALPLHALNNRSPVSVNGLDANPCTLASPSRSFTQAILATKPGGEIVALDSAGYGPFTISGSITVSGAPGTHAALTVTTGAGITLNAISTDNVTIRNLVLIGAGGNSGLSGT